jgi:hypothetical protein
MATPRRETQSLIGTIQYCLRHSSVLGYELAWRWLFGIPALWIVLDQALRIYSMVPQETLTRLEAAAYDPVKASAILVVLVEALLPALMDIVRWLAPVLLVAWAIVSGLGRWFVLRRVAALRSTLLPHRPQPSQAIALIFFQALRIAGLVVAFLAGFFLISKAAGVAFANVEDPNLVFYFAVIIVSVLGLFTVWALTSWMVNLAPLLLVRERAGFFRSALQSATIGRVLTSKLMEVNLVLGIVKLALLVLAMVFSAIPLPFESVTTPHQLHVWWTCVTIAYLVVNAFFQVVRLIATLELLEFYRPASPTG